MLPKMTVTNCFAIQLRRMSHVGIIKSPQRTGGEKTRPAGNYHIDRSETSFRQIEADVQVKDDMASMSFP